MNTVFADTVGLLALWDVSDQWHDSAERAFAAIVNENASLITTSFVLLECANAAARRPYRLEVDRLRTALEAAGGLFTRPTRTGFPRGVPMPRRIKLEPELWITFPSG